MQCAATPHRPPGTPPPVRLAPLRAGSMTDPSTEIDTYRVEQEKGSVWPNVAFRLVSKLWAGPDFLAEMRREFQTEGFNCPNL